MVHFLCFRDYNIICLFVLIFGNGSIAEAKHTYIIFLFETVSYVSRSGLELAIQLRITLAFWSSCLYFLSAEISHMYHCIRFSVDRPWGVENARQASTVPTTELHPSPVSFQSNTIVSMCV